MRDNWVETLSVAHIEPSAENVIAIDIDKIEPNPFQPRREIIEEKIKELADSIKACGLIQPIVVRRTEQGYQIIVGERRVLACRKLGWNKISAAVRNISDSAMASVALIENLQRENLNYLEEALGYTRLLEEFKLTQEELARRLGKKQSTIANKIRLLKLTPAVRKVLLSHNLSERHARALLTLDSEKAQLAMVEEIAANSLTVSQAERKIEESKNKISKTGKITRGRMPVIRDMRIVLNTIRKAVSIIESSGLYPEVDETVGPDYIEVNIRLTRDMIKTGRATKR